MRIQKIFFAFFLASFFFYVPTVSAQKKKESKHSEFSSHLWYGGNIGLNFYGFNGGNVFQIGVAPMVGYKIVEPLSVGPRVSFMFSSVKVPSFKAVGIIDVDAGLFMRLRIFRGLFIQGEVSNEWYQEPLFYSNGTTDKVSNSRVNPRLGLGWNWSEGRGAGSEIGIFYNFAIANDLNTYQNPLDYRFGFTWNF